MMCQWNPQPQYSITQKKKPNKHQTKTNNSSVFTTATWFLSEFWSAYLGHHIPFSDCNIYWGLPFSFYSYHPWNNKTLIQVDVLCAQAMQINNLMIIFISI